MWKKTIKGQISGRQKTTIAVAFNILKIVGVEEARNWKGISQFRSSRK